MPTGYTAGIGEGMQFEEFILGCARAFGATIDMRDEPLSAPMPDKFEASDYHDTKLVTAKAQYDDLKSLSARQIEQKALQWNGDERLKVDRLNQERKELKKKYESILLAAKSWEPPTKEHQGLKDFMLNQLNESIKFDCASAPEHINLSAQEWFEMQESMLLWDIKYHAKGAQEDKRRACERSLWVSQLKSSISAKSSTNQ